MDWLINILQKFIAWLKSLFPPVEPPPPAHLWGVVSKYPKASLYYISGYDSRGIPIMKTAVYSGTDNRVYIEGGQEISVSLTNENPSVDSKTGLTLGLLDGQGVDFAIITNGLTSSSKNAAGFWIQGEHFEPNK